MSCSQIVLVNAYTEQHPNPKLKMKAKAAVTSDAKRHQKTLKIIRPSSKAGFRRLMQRGGVKRIATSACDAMDAKMRKKVRKVLEDMIVFCKSGKRKTIILHDLKQAVKNQGSALYG